MPEQPTTTAAAELCEHIDIAELMDALEGRTGLRVSKPTTNGLHQYVWRMVRFNAGIDTSMPATASWWLQDYLDEHGIEASVSGVTDDAGTEITALLDAVADAVIIGFNQDPTAGARRWQQAGAV